MRVRAGQTVVCAGVLLAVSVAGAGVTSRQSLSSGGAQGTARSAKPGVSADGRWVAFISAAPNLVAGDGDLLIDVFVHDRQTGTTTLVSKSSAGVKGNADSGYFFNNGAVPAVSATGRYVAFASSATNLVPGLTGGVFVHDRDADGDGIFDEPGAVATIRMNVATDGTPGNNWSSGPAISANGRFVSFFSSATNLVPGDNNGAIDVFLHDRDTDGDGVFDEPGATSTQRVSVGPGGVEANGWSFDGDSPSLSFDGGIVAFTSDATNLVPNDTNDARDVFVYDRLAHTTERVNVSWFGAQTQYLDSFNAGLSANGRFVAFVSADPLAAPSAYEPGYYDVFIHDRATGATTTWTQTPPPGLRLGYSPFAPRLSADGRLVAFTVRFGNYYEKPGEAFIYVHDRVADTTTALSIGEGDDFLHAEDREFALSDDGRAIAFESVTATLADADTNGVADVFVHDCALPIAGQTAFCEPIPLAPLDASSRGRFVAGAQEFMLPETEATGLGPVFNDVSCSGCHNRPLVGGSSTRTVTRIGRIGPNGFDDLAAFGGPIIQEHGSSAGGCFVDGEVVPAEATIVAPRDTPALFGLGLLDKLSDNAILRYADPDDRNGDGISGRANMIGGRVGRFGRKAQIVTLAEFAADAYLNEMGVTTPARPNEVRPQGMDPVCDLTGEPEDTGHDVGAFTDFVTLLAPLQPGYAARQVKRATRDGARLFKTIGCQACHMAKFKVVTAPPSGRSVKVVLWSDLLLHDMGPGLADGIVQGVATGSEFRTPPLWGVFWSPPYLHDGRASTLEAAIVLHGGEATGARDAFLGLAPDLRLQVVAFVKSL